MAGAVAAPAVKPGAVTPAEGGSPCVPCSDRDLLIHLLRHADVEATAAGLSIEAALGVTGAQLAAIAAFVGFDYAALIRSGATPPPDEEQAMLRELLMRHRSLAGDIGEWLACIIARRAMEPHHLWEDLGLPERPDLTHLMMRHFRSLAAGNTRNMRWKRFLYRAICESEGFTMCPSPTCDACSEFHICYSDDSGLSALARNGRSVGESSANK